MRRKNTFSIVMIVLLLVLSLVGLYGCNNESVPSRSSTPVVEDVKNQEGDLTSVKKTVKPEEGFLAPDFSFQDKDGKTVSINELAGKPIFIYFWASW